MPFVTLNRHFTRTCLLAFAVPSSRVSCWIKMMSPHAMSSLQCLAAWLDGSALVSISEVTLRRALLVLGWVTICGRINHLVCNQPLRPTQPSTVIGTENEYRPKCSDTLQLESKGRYGSFQLWINVWVAGKTV